MRPACASLVVLALVLAKGLSLPGSRREWGGTVLLGALVLCQTVLIQIAVKHLPVTLAILLFYTYPFFTALMAHWLGTHRFSRPLVMALAVAFAGLGLVLGVTPHSVAPIGVATALGSALFFAAALTFTPRLAPGTSAPMRTFLMMGFAATILASVAAASGNLVWPDTRPGWAGLAGMAGLYGLGIVGLYLLLPRVGAVQAAIVLNLEPVLVALVASVALAETLRPLQAAGAAIVVGAVIVAQVSRNR